ncbi:UNVERIFIED_CONTAM: folate family ECF transporter S component [Streptococcus canis]|uniref:Folate transporter FolT n=2 Tax=Streptococcus canis TaxID=1329 RepID=A0AAV3FUX8_STRCB|nr:folate family ECF transporter S component [Streptococcus canis]EIQ82866.1 hypothetical protein SCAZ3_10905 [Streptococcus canis FSL Z3-227]MDV5988387.1 folate family ECF transporter S component [Streptococcus canis]MDV5992863.1 folate family ECF transporter S component [Streptococcus canis]MDV6000519.1 folate family ECF transporter S component [Streptococcus canis]MDV6022022.1 folate family ECF transporter S component [Streptococcus canis]
MLLKQNKLSVSLISMIAFLLALDLILVKFSLHGFLAMFSLSFIDRTLIGTIAGPIFSGVALGFWNIVSFFLSGGKQFIIWFPLVQAVQGFFYGLFFYKRKLSTSSKKDWLYVTFATLIILGSTTFLLTPIVLHFYYNMPFLTLYTTRLVKLIEIPVHIIITMLLLPRLQSIKEFQKFLTKR